MRYDTSAEISYDKCSFIFLVHVNSYVLIGALMGAQFIFQITDLTKKFGQRELLKNINVAFYPGAKIGLLGRNGAGKSTLMKIMAGIDAEYEGEARLSDGFSVGYLEQEPELDAEKNSV